MKDLNFAVLDFETTGLMPKSDRVVEIAVVHLDGSGEVTGRWETLLNPGRDLGAQTVHRISASEVLEAPTFDAIAGHLLELLRGRAVVAHNAPFDRRFLQAELLRAGAEVEIPSEAMLCTMSLSRHFLDGGRSLADCCAAFDIEISQAHRASADAEATAKLLAAFLEERPEPSWWWRQTGEAMRLRWPTLPVREAQWVMRREAGRGEPHFLERITNQLPGHAASEAELEYLGLIDRSLLDRWLTEHEKSELVGLAGELGLSRADCEALHGQYFEGVARVAWQDRVLTQEEKDDLKRVASLLAIPDAVLLEALERPREEWLQQPAEREEATSFRLVPGDRVALTGEMRRPRESWCQVLESHGLVPSSSVTKKVKLVAAADPDSLSGKARKARDYGIPVVSEEGLSSMLPR